MFQLRQQARTRLVETLALTRPAAPLVAAQGVAGVASVSYAIVALNNSGHSEVSQNTTILNSALTLTALNFNQINWQAVPNASGYQIWRVTQTIVSPAQTGLIGTVGAVTTFNDTGLAGDSATAPTTNTSGITVPFWTEDELHQLLVAGCRDLWKSIVDLHQGHFVRVVDPSTTPIVGTMVYPVGVTATMTLFTGVPLDCFRILNIEPVNLGNSGANVFSFRPKQMSSADFQAARAMALQGQGGTVIYYDILNAGSPVNAPTLIGAPPVSTAIPIRLMYVYTLPTLVDTDSNPIPGESDNALIAWCVAYAKAKEADSVNRVPDPGWLAIYATEKQGLLVALTPRQEQEEEVVEGLFEGYA